MATLHKPAPQIRIDHALDVINKLSKKPGNSTAVTQMQAAARDLLKTGLPNLSPLVPILLNLKGRPYTLENHFPFEPFFNTMLSRNLVLKTGRQVSKSTSLAAQGVVLSSCLPYFNTLFVTPLYEMVRRFSNNYVRGFIEQSPVRHLLTGTSSSSNVLQRSFTNNSNMYFSFAFMDADRTRGLNCDKVAYDECQDLDPSFIPIIRETMSGSVDWGISQYAGTPKTLDNTLEGLWQRSSQAEWLVPCNACGYENIPAMSHDLDAMIGPWHEDISEEKPGIICAKCKRPIFPRQGYWCHTFPERIADFAGYHVPQVIMPMHYASADKWQILTGKQEGWFGTSTNVFYNEVCGESYDTGSKVVTLTEIKAAAKLHPNKEEEAVKVCLNYDKVVLSVDWGGGGVAGTSFTTYAVLGIKVNSSQIDVIYGYRSLTPHDFDREAKLCLYMIKKFNCAFLVHDYTGAGAHREKFVIDNRFPEERIIPVWYVRAASQAMFRHVPACDAHPRSHYKCDKARSLVLTCMQIKTKQINFFEYDYEGDDKPGLLHDFLALVEEKVDSRTGRDIYTITRQQNMSDDFAHSVNMGCCALWHMFERWPDLAAVDNYKATQEVLDAVDPANGADWLDLP